MLVPLAAACKKTDEPEQPAENKAPAIAGTHDLTVEAGSEIDVLSGVTASDEEDGDLTARIAVSATPSLTFTNGKAIPQNPGTYELVYSVTDNGGKKAEAYATLTVTRKTAEPVLYKDFDFDAAPENDAHGWEPVISDSVQATAGVKEGSYVFEITDSTGGGDDAIRLDKKLELEPADYKLKVWVKSTKDAMMHIIARKDNDGWDVLGGAWNIEIGEHIAAHEINFTVSDTKAAELRLHFGMVRWDEVMKNPTDAYTVTIDKIELYKTVGSESEVVKHADKFAENTGLTVDAGDGANASVGYADGKAVLTIANYPTEGGVWSVKANLDLGGQKIENGKKYFYRFTVHAQYAQAGECLVESATLYHEARANFNGFGLDADKETVLSGVFTATSDIDDPVIRLQIGNASEGVANNVLTFSGLVFGTLEGDKDVTKTTDSFVALGAGTASESNAALPFATFNGTDEDNEKGVGVIWIENGKLYYRIDDGGLVDWHNKLICGYRENPLVLPADSYFTIEIKAKASKAVSCGFFLNQIGEWNPRIAERIDFTTEEQTFTFSTDKTLVTEMNFEMLFQFGSAELAELGEVTVEISEISIHQLIVE